MFILPSRESDGGAIFWTNQHLLKGVADLQVFRLFLWLLHS